METISISCTSSTDTAEKKRRFGPIRTPHSPEELAIEIKPFTLFIGPQGTGKSLISQLLYFFRDADYLLAKRSRTGDEPDDMVRRIIEGIRTGEATERAFTTFLESTHQIKYQSLQGAERAISLSAKTRKIAPLGEFGNEITGWLSQSDWRAKNVVPRAIFVPSERSFFSRFINAKKGYLYDPVLPITLLEFTDMVEKAGRISLEWQMGHSSRPDQAETISRWAKTALRGEARYASRGKYAKFWQWVPNGTDKAIELEMASSGQMEAWPLIVISEALFAWEDHPIFLHVEEPETHLHPAAQVEIVKILAYLVNQGFRVVVTTHSLTVLYTLNNLMRRYGKVDDLSLDPDNVAAYHFASDGKIHNILEDDFISEVELGQVNDVLGTEFYRLSGWDETE